MNNNEVDNKKSTVLFNLIKCRKYFWVKIRKIDKFSAY